MDDSTKRLTLVSIDEQLARAVGEDAAGFEVDRGLKIGAHLDTVREVLAQTMAMIQRRPRPEEFGGYLAFDPVTTAVIGTCGFRDGPDAEGVVEIAYFTFPELEGKGWATTMASSLVRMASSRPAVRRIIAHTLPERNASTRILEKIGMVFVGVFEDPEDGAVWRWEKVPE